MAEIRVYVDHGDASGERQVELVEALVDQVRGAQRMIDADEKTSCTIRGNGNATALTLITDQPVDIAEDTVVTVQLAQHENLGCFRLLATSAERPRLLLDLEAERAATAGDGQLDLLVNLGGDQFLDAEGRTWLSSQLFDDATFGHEGGRAVTDADALDPLSGSAQRGILAFRATVPNGNYDVTLYFCERWSSTPRSRVFSIAVEGRVVQRGFDLLRASGGRGQPFILPLRNIPIGDGRLDVDFQPASESALALLNAIRIRRRR